MYFLEVLNIHLGGEKIISKNAMSEFQHLLMSKVLIKKTKNSIVSDIIND